MKICFYGGAGAVFFCVLAFPVRAASPVAGSVVSSKEWKVRRGAQTEEEFIGEVHYRTGRTLLTSDWALFKHATQDWRARGRVHVERQLDDGAVLTVQGDEAVYDQRVQRGAMTGRDGISFLRTPQDEQPDHGRADRSEWQGPNRAAAVGAVRIWGPRMEAQADRADYDLIPGELKLTGGRPVLLKLAGFDPSSSDWVGALQGDVVTSYENPRRLSADGKARGWLDFTQAKKEKARGD